MKSFATLYFDIEHEAEIESRIALLSAFLATELQKNAVLSVSLLMGSKMKPAVTKQQLKAMACELALIEDWMFQECLAQGISYLDAVSYILPSGISEIDHPLEFVFEVVRSLPELKEEERYVKIVHCWKEMNVFERILFNQWITGTSKFKVSAFELAKALTNISGIRTEVISIRLAKLNPMIFTWKEMLDVDTSKEEDQLPFVFAPMQELDVSLERIGQPSDWEARWVLDGLPAQLVKAKNSVNVWGPDGNLMSDYFPELASSIQEMEGFFVITGTIIGWTKDGPDTKTLQSRLSRTNVNAKVMETFPIMFVVNEMYSIGGSDSVLIHIPKNQVSNRVLKSANRSKYFLLSEEIEFNSWDSLADYQQSAPMKGSVGIEIFQYEDANRSATSITRCLKRNDVHQMRVVLLYVQSGLYLTSGVGFEYTFGLWKGKDLIPVAKTSEGIGEEDRLFIQEFVKQNTIEKFGPVKNIKPVLVFELSFTAILSNARKKSGIDLVNPVVVRRHSTLTPAEAHQLEDALKLLNR